jgi:general secretion pathway protein I
MGANRGRRSARGYTLIEVLVAFMILAMALTVLLRIFSGGLRNVSVAADYTQAVLIAETQLALTALEDSLAPGTVTGEADGKFRWTRTTRRYAPFAGSLRPPGVPAFHVGVSVEWPDAGRTRTVQLATVRLVPPERQRR